MNTPPLSRLHLIGRYLVVVFALLAITTQVVGHPLVQYATRAEVRAAMVAAGASITHTGDQWWILPSDAEVMQRAVASGVREREYVPEAHDCDNFALALAAVFSGSGYCFGIIWGLWLDRDTPSHAANWYLSDKREIVFLDPITYGRLSKPALITLMMVC